MDTVNNYISLTTAILNLIVAVAAVSIYIKKNSLNTNSTKKINTDLSLDLIEAALWISAAVQLSIFQSSEYAAITATCGLIVRVYHYLKSYRPRHRPETAKLVLASIGAMFYIFASFIDILSDQILDLYKINTLNQDNISKIIKTNDKLIKLITK
ncbi:hypothetical protein [Halothiobacillus neapolitanus]|uniref:Uncharacterized protein n=1 Tax=Halothiobacillus neapolitanus (strain ATCC 23641 / DSM 15147 / CIP 104769 / NCIMB 8539 / c2) TaxID=555778 RepID=D0KZH1_HALNC|nr:hypothetical protein [Halothiobacillus neapolitanus]ACX95844.1 hypothetical protein Hneap_1008 [Halothiobacillus neapolitanus c2]TDN66155.1 hypothetical protein C8D83_101481 [Halothiobacillus neapolitanus]